MWVWLQWQERGPCAAPSPISHLTPDPSLRTARILATWTIRGFVHGAARRGGKWRSAMVRCTSVLVLPAVTVATWMQLRSPSTTFYMSHGASLAVQSVRRGRAWYLCDHSSERLGSGLGAQLRQEVSEHLTREACGTGVELRLKTRVPAVAEWALSAGFAEQSMGTTKRSNGAATGEATVRSYASEPDLTGSCQISVRSGPLQPALCPLPMRKS